MNLFQTVNLFSLETYKVIHWKGASLDTDKCLVEDSLSVCMIFWSQKVVSIMSWKGLSASNFASFLYDDHLVAGAEPYHAKVEWRQSHVLHQDECIWQFPQDTFSQVPCPNTNFLHRRGYGPLCTRLQLAHSLNSKMFVVVSRCFNFFKFSTQFFLTLSSLA